MLDTSATTSTSTTRLGSSLQEYGSMVPCIRYGFPPDKGPVQAPKLRSIFDSIPTNASTASPVYLLTRGEFRRQETFESGYEVKGETSIAKILQDSCEADGRVLYPLHIESDKFLEEEPITLIEWFREFVEDYLEFSFSKCILYFSGNRSIHVHIPRFVKGERQLKRIKKLAEAFCDETDADLDRCIYSRKRMFRLPGAKHAESALMKVEIEPDWGRDRIIRASTKAQTGLPESYAKFLQYIFGSTQSTTQRCPTSESSHNLTQWVDTGDLLLDINADTPEPPLIERSECPEDSLDAFYWRAYNFKEFSPYANSGRGSQSIAALHIEGGAFARKEKRSGTTLVPTFFHGAMGCAGEFVKDDVPSPLQLSKKDYEKWDFEEGDSVVVIGGQSRQSLIFSVTSSQAIEVGRLLTEENGSRRAALDYLEEEGYDTGKGVSRGANSPPTGEGPGTNSGSGSFYDGNSKAANLMRQADGCGIDTLSPTEKWCVGCRALKWGWTPAWEWFKEQFGPEFKPDVTRDQFIRILDEYPEDYPHIKNPRDSGQ